MSVSFDETRALPRLLTGARRRVFACLLLTGIAQAGAAGATVLVLTHGLEATTTTSRIVAVLLLGAIAVVIGWLRSQEYLLAERLGQDYVHEIRVQVVRGVLERGGTRSLGATVTRASNDLNAVRNWVALGIAPTTVAVPMLLGCAVVLGLIHPVLAVAVVAPLAVLGGVLLVASRLAFEKARQVRQKRGRLAGHLADMVVATAAIRSAGGGYRELRRVDRLSSQVVEAAIDRARVAGRIRGAAVSAAAVATATVIGGSLFVGLGGADLAAGLIVVGLLAAPVQDLGRVVEYRQSYRAARQMLAPALAPGRRAEKPTADTTQQHDAHPSHARSGAAFYGGAGLVVSNLRLPEQPDEALSPLYARAGDRVVVQAVDRARSTAVIDAVVGVHHPVQGVIRVNGKDLRDVGYRERRELLGYAAQGMRLERTSIARAVSYRHPGAEPAGVSAQLSCVGLAERVATLPGRERTLLRQGGDPLTPPDRARLLLARALYGNPPLLVLDHLDAELGEDGRKLLRNLLTDYAGIVLLASDTPEAVMTPTRRWVVG